MSRNEKLLNLVEKKLNSNEKIISYVDGAFESTVNGRKSTLTGLLVATNEKIRFCGKRFFLIYDDEIEYKDIDGVQVQAQKLGDKIFINGELKSYSMNFVISKEIHKFIDTIKNNII